MGSSYKETFEARGHDYNLAGALCPTAREAERTALLDRAVFSPGQVILDIPAGGGYVADGLCTRVGFPVEIVCVEPSPRFSEAISGPYRVLNNPIDAVEMPDASIDVVLSLAGLHHLHEREPVYRKWHRLLKPGGQLVVADVGIGTPTASFLNEFVDRYTEGGHKGIFFAEGEFEHDLAAAGFAVRESILEDVPWRFPDRNVMGTFCRTLFSTRKATVREVADGLAEYVGVTEAPTGGVAVQWQLRYAVAGVL